MNAVDHVSIKKKQEQQRLAAKQYQEDFKKLVTVPEFRRFFWELLSRTGIYTTSFHQSGSVVYFNEGRREIGLRYMSEINDMAPEALLKMITDNKPQQTQVAEDNKEG